MFRIALGRLSKAAATTAIRTSSGDRLLRRATPFLSRPLSASARLSSGDNTPNANSVAVQMINYALNLARSQKTDKSYAEALLVLEQCLTSQSTEGEDSAAESSKAMVLLAVSTLMSERGNIDEAMQALLRIQDLTSSSLGIRVAAVEALVGLNLELGLDDTSSVLADKCVKLLEKEGQQVSDEIISKVLNARAKAIKGLVELAQCDMESAKALFEGCEDEGCIGSAALSYGEFLHAKRDFTSAKEFYQRAISGSAGNKDLSDPHTVAAGNMSSTEVHLAATCALGQLESCLGNFGDAEEILTKALKLAEEHFGSYHPKVGVVLTCIAQMYRQKAVSEHSSYLIIQEGLYRKAIDLLKAPSLETDGAKESLDRRDIMALARGGYAEALCVQENRKVEGEKMRTWAEAAWRNRRLSLSEALDVTELSSKVPVIDTRICRAL